MYRFVFAVLLAALAAPAQQQPVLGQGVRLDDLVNEALLRNREILKEQKVVEAAQQRRSIDSTLPDPMVSFGYTNSNPTPILRDSPENKAGLMFTQEIPFPGKLKLKGEMAASHAKATFQELQVTRLEVVSRVKQAYYQLHYLTRARETIERNRDLLHKFASVAEARYSVGKGTQQDVLKAQTEHSRLFARMAMLDRESGAMEAELRMLLNRPPEAPVGRLADYPRATLRPGIEELLAHASDNAPRLIHDRYEIDFTQAGLNLARRGYYPDFAVTTSYFQRRDNTPEFEVRVDVKVPLYFWRKQRYEVKENTAYVSQWKHQYEADAQELNRRIKDDYLAAKASEKVADLYEKAIMKQAALTLESSLSSYETGAVDFLTLLTNLMTVLDTELTYYEELATYHKALARLEAATGMRLLN